MGYLQASEMARLTDLDTALRWHLTSNHFPPLPESLIPVVKLAIGAAEAGDWNRKLLLPPGIRYKGEEEAPVSACVEAWHLDAFIEREE